MVGYMNPGSSPGGRIWAEEINADFGLEIKMGKERRALGTELWVPPKLGQGHEEPAKETEKESPVR